MGVFKEVRESTEVTKVEKTFICGKLIRVKDLLITCPKNVLEEKWINGFIKNTFDLKKKHLKVRGTGEKKTYVRMYVVIQEMT